MDEERLQKTSLFSRKCKPAGTPISSLSEVRCYVASAMWVSSPISTRSTNCCLICRASIDSEVDGFLAPGRKRSVTVSSA
eukprot:6183133-Pleurochrysis_carterae.AAC.1